MICLDPRGDTAARIAYTILAEIQAAPQGGGTAGRKRDIAAAFLCGFRLQTACAGFRVLPRERHG
jgi:hypothetical protein